jgi:hypothetical protein
MDQQFYYASPFSSSTAIFFNKGLWHCDLNPLVISSFMWGMFFIKTMSSWGVKYATNDWHVCDKSMVLLSIKLRKILEYLTF